MKQISMKLDIMEKLRKIAKEKFGNDWIGIESLSYNGIWHAKCIIYQEIYPCRVELIFRDRITIKKIENLKRVPMHVVYINSALEELENANRSIENNDFEGAIKSLWGSTIYALKAYGLILKGCRIVETSPMELALEFSKSTDDKAFFDKIKRVYSTINDPFGVSLESVDVRLMQEDVRDVIERIVNEVLR